MNRKAPLLVPGRKVLKTLRMAWSRGINPLLYYGRFQAARVDGKTLTESDRKFLRRHKQTLIDEIKNMRSGTRIDLEKVNEW
jgi:hypothetical protein